MRWWQLPACVGVGALLTTLGCVDVREAAVAGCPMRCVIAGAAARWQLVCRITVAVRPEVMLPGKTGCTAGRGGLHAAAIVRPALLAVPLVATGEDELRVAMPMLPHFATAGPLTAAAVVDGEWEQ